MQAQIQLIVEQFFKRRDGNHITEVFEKFSDPSAGRIMFARLGPALEALGVIRPKDEIEVLWHSIMDIDTDGGLDLQEFQRAVLSPTKLEQWATTLPLAQLLASCLPINESESKDPIRDVSRLGEAELTAVVQIFFEGLKQLLEGSQVALKMSFEELDKRTKEGTDGASSKFSTFDMSGGGVEDFHKGLPGRVGAPHPNLSKGMEEEHCVKGGCDEEFETTNYGVKSTPRKEYLISTGKEQCPEVDMFDKQKSKKVREIKSMASLMALPLVKNAALIFVEILAVVMYSGPCFQVYNAILRRHPYAFFQRFESHGNMFSTTIHVLVSAVLKLSRSTKLPTGLQLYRGLGGQMKLPASFYKTDAKGRRGYMEWAFLSTTASKEVAVEYAGAAAGEPLPIVLSYRGGSIDRGACIVDFSQYPLEAEYVVVPCSFLEPTGEQVVEMVLDEGGGVAGVVTVVQVRVNANPKALTVEELLGQKKSMHLTAFRCMIDEVCRDLRQLADEHGADKRLAADPYKSFKRKAYTVEGFLEGIVKECEETLSAHEKREDTEYGKDEVFRSLSVEALNVKTAALSKLRWWLADESACICLLQDMKLRDAHRGLVAFLRRLMGGEQGLARLSAALGLCKLKGLVEQGAEDKNELGETRIVSGGADGLSRADLRLLIEAGSGPDDVSKALLKAATYGQDECVRFLIESQAEIEVRDEVNQQSCE